MSPCLVLFELSFPIYIKTAFISSQPRDSFQARGSWNFLENNFFCIISDFSLFSNPGAIFRSSIFLLKDLPRFLYPFQSPLFFGSLYKVTCYDPPFTPLPYRDSRREVRPFSHEPLFFLLLCLSFSSSSVHFSFPPLSITYCSPLRFSFVSCIEGGLPTSSRSFVSTAD